MDVENKRYQGEESKTKSKTVYSNKSPDEQVELSAKDNFRVDNRRVDC